MPADQIHPQRLFLDTGVILEGCFGRWGAAKGVLILATERRLYTVVLAEAVDRELQRNITYTLVPPTPSEARAAAAEEVSGWLRRVRIERWPLPSVDDIERHAPTLMPVLRHRNDLPVVVSAMQARPDWVISANREHWNEVLAQRTALRIVTPREFLGQLRPMRGDRPG
jgi:hypothetical protein